jgi:sortase A
MNRVYYQKRDTRNLRKILRLVGLSISLTGVIFGAYFFFPLLSWQIYLQPAFASSTFASPIPQRTIVTKDYLQSLWQNTANSFRSLTAPSSQGWMPSSVLQDVQVASQVSYYFISIPKLKIDNAVVSTIDVDLSQHMVNFPGTAIPPAKGNAVIFGHSTLPQLFDPKNYKTILANAHTLVVGDELEVTSHGILTKYRIEKISIVDPEALDPFMTQDSDDSYITIITCTPPGTTWKRLIIRARAEKS